MNSTTTTTTITIQIDNTTHVKHTINNIIGQHKLLVSKGSAKHKQEKGKAKHKQEKGQRNTNKKRGKLNQDIIKICQDRFRHNIMCRIICFVFIIILGRTLCIDTNPRGIWGSFIRAYIRLFVLCVL